MFYKSIFPFAANSIFPRFLFPRGLSRSSPYRGFSLANLPYGVFLPPGQHIPRIGVAIGDRILDLRLLAAKKILDDSLSSYNLNLFMSRGKHVWEETREKIKRLLSDDDKASLGKHDDFRKFFFKQRICEMFLPASIGDYTEFYASEYHARNVGMIYKSQSNENALPGNWRDLPIGFHGRASSVVVSGTTVRRPKGQILQSSSCGRAKYLPTEELDFEVELGCFIGGKSNQLGDSISIGNANDSIFGFVLLNDWSARDIQKFEYSQPIGPFLGKSFATSIGTWVVPMSALANSRCKQENCGTLPYLQNLDNLPSHFDISVNAAINGKNVTRSNSKYLYWSFEQLISHHSSNGCNLKPGDLLASGTISGPSEDSFGSLMELGWNRTKPVEVGTEVRTYLDDDDEVTLTGTCLGEDGVEISFGECKGKILPA